MQNLNVPNYNLSEMIGCSSRRKAAGEGTVLQNGLIDLLTGLRSADGIDSSWRVAERYFRELQFDVINCAVMDSQSNTLIGFHSNMSEDWMQHYYDSDYGACDPLVKYANENTADVLFLQENRVCFPSTDVVKSNKMLDEALDQGIRSSLLSTFQSTSFDHKAAFNLGSNLDSKRFTDHFRHKRDEILIAVALVPNYLCFDDINTKLNGRWFPSEGANVKLSPRELETLHWLSSGLRNDRIADKMKIAAVTVNFHMLSIKKKLNAKTREHAVALAIKQNLIAP